MVLNNMSESQNLDYFTFYIEMIIEKYIFNIYTQYTIENIQMNRTRSLEEEGRVLGKQLR